MIENGGDVETWYVEDRAHVDAMWSDSEEYENRLTSFFEVFFSKMHLECNYIMPAMKLSRGFVFKKYERSLCSNGRIRPIRRTDGTKKSKNREEKKLDSVKDNPEEYQLMKKNSNTGKNEWTNRKLSYYSNSGNGVNNELPELIEW